MRAGHLIGNLDLRYANACGDEQQHENKPFLSQEMVQQHFC
jgi:hypothetical protein